MRIGRAEIKVGRWPIMNPRWYPRELRLVPIGFRDLSTLRIENYQVSFLLFQGETVFSAGRLRTGQEGMDERSGS